MKKVVIKIASEVKNSNLTRTLAHETRKKMNKIGILLLVLVVFFTGSCVSNKNSSTNDFVEQWINSNIDEISELRVYFKSEVLDKTQEQRVNEDKFTSFQRQAVWVGKILEVLNLDWTEKEREHIQKLLEIMVTNPIMFSYDPDDSDSEAFMKGFQLIEEWLVYAKEELEWDDELLHAIGETQAEMREDKTVHPKFLKTYFRLIDGVYVPHVIINGAYVRSDSLDDVPVPPNMVIIDGEAFPADSQQP